MNNSICLSKDCITTPIITPTKFLEANCSNKYDSLNSLSPIMDDTLYTNINKSIQDINMQELCLDSVLENDGNNNKSYDFSPIDNNISEQEKCHIICNIKLDKSLNVVKSRTRFIQQLEKNEETCDNNLYLHDNGCLQNNNESSLNGNITQNFSVESTFNRNTENVSSSSKFDPTYESSQLNILMNNILEGSSSTKKNENTADTSQDSQDKSSLSCNFERLNVQTGACNDAAMFVTSSQD